MSKIKTLIITALLAYCSISYELILANTLSFLTGEQIYWQTITIGVFILGLGLGSYYSEEAKDKEKSLEYVELGLSFVGFLSIPIIIVVTGIYKYYKFILILKGTPHAWELITQLSIIFFILVQSITFIIGFLSGFEIPLIISISKSKESLILGINYIGTLIGSLVLSLFLMSRFPIVDVTLIITALNILAYVLLVKTYRKKLFGVLILSAYIYSGLNFFDKFEKYYYNFFYAMQEVRPDATLVDLIKESINGKSVERIKSKYQNIDLVNKERSNIYGEKIHTFNVFIDTNYQFGSESEHLYHEGFAHVPILLNNEVPKNVLILGAGDGLLLRELLKYPEIEHITKVELDEKMVEISNSNPQILAMNKGSINSKKLNMIIGDGFAFARNSKIQYDAIYIDFPYPKSHDLAKLYSREFYGFINKALKPNGFVALDAPLSEKSKNEDDINYHKRLKNNSVILSSISFAGFPTILPFAIKEESFVFFKKNDLIFKENLNTVNVIFSKDTQVEVLNIKNQKFMHLGIEKKFINSVFKPIVGSSQNPFESN